MAQQKRVIPIMKCVSQIIISSAPCSDPMQWNTIWLAQYINEKGTLKQ